MARSSRPPRAPVPLPGTPGVDTTTRTHRMAGQRAATASTVRTVEVINPQGERQQITNLRAYCREHGLGHQQMFDLSKGRVQRYRGFTSIHAAPVPPERAPQRVSTWTVIAPDGQVITIVNLAAFCRAHGLKPPGFRQLKIGRVQHYRGYRLAPDVDKPRERP